MGTTIWQTSVNSHEVACRCQRRSWFRGRRSLPSSDTRLTELARRGTVRAPAGARRSISSNGSKGSALQAQKSGSDRYVVISSDCQAGADMGLLQREADRVGPSVDEVNEPLRSDELPDDPNFGFIVETYLGLSNLVGPKKD
jgi:hypothetical protein